MTQEDTDQGVLYIAGDTSGIENSPAVSVVWAYSDGAETLEDIAAVIQNSDFQLDGIVTINTILTSLSLKTTGDKNYRGRRLMVFNSVFSGFNIVPGGSALIEAA